MYQELKTWCVQHGVKTYTHRSTQKQKTAYGCNKYLHMSISKNSNMNVFYDDNTNNYIVSFYVDKKGKSNYNFVCEYDYIPYITSFIELIKYLEV